MFNLLKKILIGKPLKTVDESNSSLSRFKALALLSSDALSSIAYGTEAITTALLAAGGLALWLQIPIAAIVLILLAAIVLSYRQIIHAYPNGGGSYSVAKENWGTSASLVAGGSLLVDYMLTVAVSSSAAADAISSAFPQIRSFNVLLAIILISLLMFLNLRGLRESATVLLVPVYTFIISMTIMIIFGLYQIINGQAPFHATAQLGTGFTGLTFILFMRAFSSGSSSLTGVEAISNAVPNFAKPKEKHAASTLAIMAFILAFFFGGVTLFSYWFGVVPQEGSTVLSKIAEEIFGGRNLGFFIIQLSTAAILAVAANTGFSAFPMLAFNLAKDRFLPHLYLDRGDRLGYSNGIISLSIGSIILILIFHGSTENLIPLYALGVFIPFTLGQSGMILHWLRKKPKNYLIKAIINFIGAAISAILVITIFILRFNHVWPYLIIVPLLLFVFYKIKRHYVSVSRQLRLTERKIKDVKKMKGSTMIVLVSRSTIVTKRAMTYAESVADKVIAVHISFYENTKQERENQIEFNKAFPKVRYVDIHTSYRSISKPTLKFIDAVNKKSGEKGNSLTVLIPQFVPKRPWQNVLHNQNALRLRQSLSSRSDIAISSYYYHLES